MDPNSNMKQLTGFTLIETIIYVSLFIFIIGGSLISASYIFASNALLEQNIFAQEEGGFILGKFRYLLRDTRTAQLSENPEMLSVTNADNTYNLVYNPAQQQVLLQKNNSNFEPLNSPDFPVINFNLDQLDNNPDTGSKVTIDFSIGSQNFKTIKYIRN